MGHGGIWEHMGIWLSDIGGGRSWGSLDAPGESAAGYRWDGHGGI